MSVEVPHLAFPFRMAPGGHAAVVEQDSLEDVSACVAVIALTPAGTRIERPEFGVVDLPFLGPDAALEVLEAAVAEHEPRAAVVWQEPAEFSDAVATIVAEVSAP